MAILLDDSFKGYHAWDSGYKSYLPSNLIPQSCNADELKTLTREMVQYPIVYAGMKATGLDKMPKNSESTFFNTLAPAGRMLACANTAKAARQYVKPKPIDRVAAEKQKTTNLNELRRSIKLT